MIFTETTARSIIEIILFDGDWEGFRKAIQLKEMIQKKLYSEKEIKKEAIDACINKLYREGFLKK